MAGGASSSPNSKETIYSCYGCGKLGHFMKDCKWNNYPCVRGRTDHYMKFGISTKDTSKGREFISCRKFGGCNGFKWVDEIKEEAEATKKKTEPVKIEDSVTLKITSEDNVVFSVEGSVSAITDIVKKLAIRK